MYRLPLAFVADDLHLVQEAHFHGDGAESLAFRAGAPGIEAEQGGRLVRGPGEFLAHRFEHPDIGQGIGARRAADRRLVDDDGLAVVGQKEIVDQAAFARAGDPGDAGQDALGDAGGDILQVMQRGVEDLEGDGPLFALAPEPVPFGSNNARSGCAPVFSGR